MRQSAHRDHRVCASATHFIHSDRITEPRQTTALPEVSAATQHPFDTPTADDPDQGKGTAILYRLMIVDDRTALPDVPPYARP